MAKKKKKTSTTKPKSETPSTAKESHSLRAHQTVVVQDEILELQIKQSEGKSFSPAPTSLKNTFAPILSLDESDAARIGARRNDEVIVLFKTKDEKNMRNEVIRGALICALDVVFPAQQSPDKTAKRRGPIARGTCSIKPQHVVDAIINRHELDVETMVPTPSTPSFQTTTPTKSTSGFSFAVGGGGDLLTTPPQSSTPKTPNNNKSSTKKPPRASLMQVWIIPATSPLGKDTASIICQKANSIVTEILDEGSVLSNPSRLSSCQKILQTLFLAQLSGRHVHDSDVISISFQGKPLKLKIQKTDSNMTGDQRSKLLLEFQMETLEIQDDFPEEDQQPDMETRLWKLLRASLDHCDFAQSLVLSKISMDTKVTFSFKRDDDDTAPASPSPQYDTPSPSSALVAGLSSTIEQVRPLLLTPLLKPHLFSKGSLKPPRGALLHGASGVGKSCLAKQIAHDLSQEYPTTIRVEFVNCASLQSYSAQVGEAERRLCAIFEKASMPLRDPAGRGEPAGDQFKGTLLIFDDIHLIARKRSGYNPGGDRLAATLLGLLDGIGSTTGKGRDNVQGAISKSIVILAITSDPSVLDPALRRPGRIDYEVEVPAPDNAATRAEIIEFQLNKLGNNRYYHMPHFTKEELLSLGELAKGFTGADCMLAVKEASRRAILRRQEAEESGNVGEQQGACKELSFVDLKAAIRATKPSAIKSITVEIPKVLWSSIGGMESVKKELREAIELPLTHAHVFERLRIPPPKGILLYGPPGCSKTLMARALATEGQMNFLAVKGPELLSKWLGESERALASLFRRARMASPSIIFFDEIDAIAATRGSGGIGTGGGRLLSQLLTEIDGVHQTGGVTIVSGAKKKTPKVVVVAATNRPDLIDSALMRPGRIDKKIHVGVPDEKSRQRIFEIGLRNRACSECIDVSKLAAEEVSGGFSGAEVVAICKEAALLALEEDDATPATSHELPSIKMRHLLQAIDGMKRQITPAMIKFYEDFRRSV